MALKQDAQRKMLERLKFTKEKIDEILGDTKEVDLEIPEYHVFDETGLTELKTNLKAGANKDYPEIWCRRMNKDYELGLSSDDAKDEVKVLAALKANTLKEANVTPAE